MKNKLKPFLYALVLTATTGLLAIKPNVAMSISFERTTISTKNVVDSTPSKTSHKKVKSEATKANDAAELSVLFSGLCFVNYFFFIPALIFKGIANRRRGMLSKTGEKNLRFSKRLMWWALGYYILLIGFVIAVVAYSGPK